MGNTIQADPVTAEVIRHALEGAADQVKIALSRSAFSPIIYDAHDFACGIYDRNIKLLSQSKTIPFFQGSLDGCLHALVKTYGLENLKPGDMILSNYGYESGSHANDVVITAPGFLDGELVSFVTIKAHMMDIGSMEPLFTTQSTDIWQEGTIFPHIKLFDGGERNESVYRMVLANSRMPDILSGDLSSMMGAAKLGVDAINGIISRFGLDEFSASMELIWDYGEKTVRNFFRDLPDGKYQAGGKIDNDGLGGDPIPFSLSLDIKGDTISIDLTDMPDQTRGPVNIPIGSTISTVRCAVMGAAGCHEPASEGHFRAIEVNTRKGSIVDPLPPAPINLYAFWAGQLADAIFEAISQADSTKVPAAGSDFIGLIAFAQNDKGDIINASCDFCSGQGASSVYGDGGGPLHHILGSGCRAPSLEVFESQVPVVVESAEYEQDSGGAGEFRGGNGFTFKIRALKEVGLVPICDRVLTPFYGLSGGEPGSLRRIVFHQADGESRVVQRGHHTIPPGAMLEVAVGGGGGFGDKSNRSSDAVFDDIRKGYISEEQARKDYPHAFAA